MIGNSNENNYTAAQNGMDVPPSSQDSNAEGPDPSGDKAFNVSKSGYSAYTSYFNSSGPTKFGA